MTTAQLVATLAGGAAAGALLTALVSLFTGWLSRRHEQRRWLLDKQLEAYVAFNKSFQAWNGGWLKGDRPQAIAHMEALIDQSYVVNLVAPAETWQTADRTLRLAMKVDRLRFQDQSPLVDELREAHALLILRQMGDVHETGLISRTRYRRALAKLEGSPGDERDESQEG